MQVVSMHVAKSSLSQLVKRAATGETILLGAYGKVEAKLVPASANSLPAKRIGILAGKLVVPDDFDSPLPPEVLDSFEGNLR
jgi:antitoxin (DNA-binding transcriptional repressor) of toxin-antitoxin stability system